MKSGLKIKENYKYDKEEEEIEILKNIIVNIRNIRANMNVVPSKKTNLIFVTQKYKTLLEDSNEFLKKLGYAENIIIQEDKKNIPSNAISIVQEGIEVFIPFEELVDIEKELERLKGEKEKLEAEVARASKMLANKGFIEKAPKAKNRRRREAN